MCVTEEQYEAACKQEEEAKKIIYQYRKEKREAFDKRLKENPIFTTELFKQLYNCEKKVLFINLELSESVISKRLEKYLKGRADGKDHTEVSRNHS